MKKLFTFLFCCHLLFLSEVVKSESPHDRKLARMQRSWNHLIPEQSKIQFAGSMGMFSFGTGWYYGKRNQWETDLFIGFIPHLNGGEGHPTITIKETFTPFRLPVNDRLFIEPLTSGIYINKIFGQYFWSRLPDKYPKNYYFWAVNTRFNVSLGQAISCRLGDRLLGKDLSLFYEFNTNDLYVLSAIGNKTIQLKDIVGLSLGIRYRLF